MPEHCDVVRDLLPLYVDGLASAGSRALVDAHVQDCAGCRETLEKLKTPAEPAPDASEADTETPPEAQNPFKKVRRKLTKRIVTWSSVAAVVAIIAAFAIILGQTYHKDGWGGIDDFFGVNQVALISTTQQKIALYEMIYSQEYTPGQSWSASDIKDMQFVLTGWSAGGVIVDPKTGNMMESAGKGTVEMQMQRQYMFACKMTYKGETRYAFVTAVTPFFRTLAITGYSWDTDDSFASLYFQSGN